MKVCTNENVISAPKLVFIFHWGLIVRVSLEGNLWILRETGWQKWRIYGGQKGASHVQIYSGLCFTFKGNGQLIYDPAKCGATPISYVINNMFEKRLREF